jgi:fumarate reductase subunit C
MTARIELWLYMAQRLSAMVLAPLVLIHLGTIVYAIRGGLTAAEILGRTEGSVFWMVFYGLFVIAAAIHGAIGLRSIVREMTPWRGRSLNVAAASFCVLVLVVGFRAVGAVT